MEKPQRMELCPWMEPINREASAQDLNHTGYLFDHGLNKDKKVDSEKALIYFLAAAAKGHVVAMQNVALFYRIGRGCSQDFSKSFSYCLKAAQGGDSDAMVALTWHFEKGKGVEPNAYECFFWSHRASTLGVAEGFRWLGRCYSKGMGCVKDTRKGLENYIKGAEKGDVISMAHLGWCFHGGHSCEQNWSTAFGWFSKAAAAGDLYSKLRLAECYEKGQGCAKDAEKAFVFYLEAGIQADKGHTVSKRRKKQCFFELAQCYERQDSGKAAVWYEKGMILEDGRAFHQMGLIAIEKKKYDRASELLLRSTQLNSHYNHCSMYRLAYLVERKRVSSPFAEGETAYDLYVKAADMGCADACRRVASAYEKGELNREPDGKAAFDWFVRAAEEGSIWGFSDLSRCYHKGIGCDPSEYQAETLDKLGTLSKDSSWRQCAICLEKGFLLQTVCKHLFHKTCLLQHVMFKKSRDCPLCRQDFVK